MIVLARRKKYDVNTTCLLIIEAVAQVRAPKMDAA
jgi:hypothetical protein